MEVIDQPRNRCEPGARRGVQCFLDNHSLAARLDRAPAVAAIAPQPPDELRESEHAVVPCAAAQAGAPENVLDLVGGRIDRECPAHAAPGTDLSPAGAA